MVWTPGRHAGNLGVPSACRHVPVCRILARFADRGFEVNAISSRQIRELRKNAVTSDNLEGLDGSAVSSEVSAAIVTAETCV